MSITSVLKEEATRVERLFGVDHTVPASDPAVEPGMYQLLMSSGAIFTAKFDPDEVEEAAEEGGFVTVFLQHQAEDGRVIFKPGRVNGAGIIAIVPAVRVVQPDPEEVGRMFQERANAFRNEGANESGVAANDGKSAAQVPDKKFDVV